MNALKMPLQESTLKEVVELLRSGLTIHVVVSDEVHALCGLALICFVVSLVLRILRR